MLSSKLRNFFHHVVSLETDGIGRNEDGYFGVEFDNHQQLVQFLKEDSLYTGLYNAHLRSAMEVMPYFKWNSELLVIHSKASDFDEARYLERSETETIQELIKDKIDKLPEPNLTDEEKVLRTIDYYEKMEKFSLIDGETPKERKNQYLNAYQNWKSNNFEKPKMG